MTLTHGPVRVALDDSGLPHVLVPLDSDVDIARDAGSRGVTLSARTLVLNGQEIVFADLACLDAKLTLVFEHLADDALQRLAASSEHPEAILATVLGEWRQLLQVASLDRLDRETAMGLAAELEVLTLLAKSAPAEALNAWRGPAQEPHDFVHGRHALEVKSTAAVDPSFIRISNLDQLDSSLVDRLHLVVVHFREEAAGKTLDDRMRELFAAGVDKQALIRKVSQYGYTFESDVDAARFTSRGIRLWHVSNNFPGLTRARLPEAATRGVSRVSYYVDLDVADRPVSVDGDARTDIERWIP
ncbi:PD-(D/E)XK motif protein [Nocardioides baculatus]|uniref:PD-(D/E)XK motif protein n=1 Tax=Nocardioides baculatus TaxID=2801337 RepID=A0ABS1LC59_9ACTN|nr:PD-(D/E)XK motif protein [Nocardioides baculatus]MBL0749254.1 PD-(D/E)XK motif protein [Nocardioides baculatus]